MCAALSLEGFTSACQVVGSAAVRVLRRPPRMRKDHHLQMLLHMFEDSALFKQDLRLVGLRMNVCRFLGVELLEAGKTLFEQVRLALNSGFGFHMFAIVSVFFCVCIGHWPLISHGASRATWVRSSM